MPTHAGTLPADRPRPNPEQSLLESGNRDAATPAATTTEPNPGQDKIRMKVGLATWLYSGLGLAGFIYLSSLLGYWPLVALIVAALFSVLQWLLGKDATIRAMGAVPADPRQYPRLHQHVAELSERAGIRKPHVYISEMPVHNALAARLRGGGVVAVTLPLLDTLGDAELRAVLAHEIGHLRNRDTLLSQIYATISRATFAVVTVVLGLVVLLVAFIDDDDVRDLGSAVLAGLASLALLGASAFTALGGRHRELMADQTGAELTDPQDLVRALEVLDQASSTDDYTVTPSLAAAAPRLFINPFRGSFSSRLLSTHPTTARRIKRLERLLGSDAVAAGNHRRALAAWTATNERLQRRLTLLAGFDGEQVSGELRGRHNLARNDRIYLQGEGQFLRWDRHRNDWFLATGDLAVVVTRRGIHLAGDRRQNLLFTHWHEWTCTEIGGLPTLVLQLARYRDPVAVAFVTYRSPAGLEETLALAMSSRGERLAQASEIERALREHAHNRPQVQL